MSLMERVKSVSLEKAEEQFSDGWLNDRDGENRVFNQLKNKVQIILPPSRMGRLIEENPYRARNEIKMACERVFREENLLFEGINHQRMVDRYLDSVFGLGPLESLLSQDEITEIMVNGARRLFYEKGGVIHEAQSTFVDDAQVYSVIDRIVSPLGRRVDESSPMVDARLPEGHRVNVIIPPLALDGPVLTIRKFRNSVFTLEELKQRNSFDDAVKAFMIWAVVKRCNIAISGGTGSGKTTLLNALSDQIPFSERIITIEDSAELKFNNHPHVVRLESRPKNSEGVGQVTIKDLVINSLRMRPDRIVVGECRGAEAIDMLQAMNTGHDGSLTTLHANSPTEAISRLTMMVRYGADLPVEVIESQIASAIDLVIQTQRNSAGKRFVSEIVGYVYDFESRECQIKTFYRWDDIYKRGKWLSYPSWIDTLPILNITTDEEVSLWKKKISLLQ